MIVLIDLEILMQLNFPSPHPGQCSNPRFERGHIVKCVELGFTKNAKYRSATIQIKPSNPISLIELKIL